MKHREMNLASPLGGLRLVATDDALVAAYYAERRPVPRIDAEPSVVHPILALAASELDEYFRGERREFSVPLAPVGTDFQRAVWRVLGEIPFGERRAYGEIAKAIGAPSAVRAVGAANGSNPIAIIVPCHRVIGADGRLTGYAGGMAAKRWLLEHERRVANPGLLEWGAGR